MDYYEFFFLQLHHFYM